MVKKGDVIDVIQNSRNDKAPGPDEVMVEVIKLKHR